MRFGCIFNNIQADQTKTEEPRGLLEYERTKKTIYKIAINPKLKQSASNAIKMPLSTKTKKKKLTSTERFC